MSKEMRENERNFHVILKYQSKLHQKLAFLERIVKETASGMTCLI